MTISADNPIRNPKDDVLGRDSLAKSFSDQLLSLDATEGLVVGILGPWGSGKTSFVNLSRRHLESAGVRILDFNPWMFSGADQLVGFFFGELSTQLRVRSDLAAIGKELEDYGKFLTGMGWLPIVGPWVERARLAMSIVSFSHRKNVSLSNRKIKVENALAELEDPIAVVVDDIDRLTTPEIRDIFKLIRLTASFPNVIYITAFDRTRVEDALSEQGIPGKDYLEKILQLGFDLPAVPRHVLDEEIIRAINKVLPGIDSGKRFHESVWPDVFVEVIRPLLRNIRDVRRYVSAIYGTLHDLDGQVAIVDVLALEAVRVFRPDLFREMHKTIDGLTTTSDPRSGIGVEPPYLKEQISNLVNVLGDDEAGFIRHLLHRLFPASQRHIGGSHYGPDWKRTWLKERRVAHEHIFRLYLERVIGKGLQAFTEAEQAWVRMADEEALDHYLRSLDPNRLQDVISHLETYEDEFASKHVIPGSVVLLNLLSGLPDRQLGMLDLGPRLVVTRVILRLLRSLNSRDAIEDAVQGITSKVKRLSAKAELITIIGYRENRGHKLVSESTARRFERDWQSEVHAADQESLAAEDNLLTTLFLAREFSDVGEPIIAISESPKVTLSLLESARSDVRSQTVGNRAVRRQPRLQWDLLVELYGGENILRQRIEDLKVSQLSGTDAIIELVEKYLGGSRPKNFGEEE